MIYTFARWFFRQVGLIPASEVVEYAELDATLTALGVTGAERHNVLEMGVAAAKLGLRDPAEVEAAARALYWQDLETIRRLVESNLDTLDQGGHLPNE